MDTWLTSLLEPKSCKSAKIAYIAPWQHGVGSSLMVFVAAALHALDLNYTVIPAPTPWIFADATFCQGGSMTHECYLQPLSSCPFVDERWRRARVADNLQSFIALAKEGASTIAWRWTRAPMAMWHVNPPNELVARMERLPKLVRQWGVTLNFVMARLQARVLRPGPVLGALIQKDTETITHQIGNPIRLSVHFRLTSDFNRQDGRFVIKLADYARYVNNWLEEIGANPSTHAVHISTDIELSPSDISPHLGNYSWALIRRDLAPRGIMVTIALITLT